MKKLFVLLIAFFTLANSLSAQTVYITKTGNKYHLDGCRYLNRSKFSIDLNDAIARGYGACSVCKPPTSASSTPRTQSRNIPNYQNGSSSNENKSSVSVQCAATTKAGTRCKRMTKSPNGLCWQHGGN